MRLLLSVLFALTLTLAAASSFSREAAPASADPVLEAQVMELAAELRCLVCQNQTIADSHSELAEDLRGQIRSQLASGATPQQIRDYMTARYGDFVLYRPPFKASTSLLWLGPGLLMVVALGALFVVLRRRQRMDPNLFEPETSDPVDEKEAR
jgi:cytochrome c-type biogenesis protein CcmH